MQRATIAGRSAGLGGPRGDASRSRRRRTWRGRCSRIDRYLRTSRGYVAASSVLISIGTSSPSSTSPASHPLLAPEPRGQTARQVTSGCGTEPCMSQTDDTLLVGVRRLVNRTFIAQCSLRRGAASHWFFFYKPAGISHIPGKLFQMNPLARRMSATCNAIDSTGPETPLQHDIRFVLGRKREKNNLYYIINLISTKIGRAHV